MSVNPYSGWTALQLVAAFDAVHTASECILMGQHRPTLEDITAPMDDELDYLGRRRTLIVQALAHTDPAAEEGRDEWARILITYETLCDSTYEMRAMASRVRDQILAECKNPGGGDVATERATDPELLRRIVA